jgi:hypothetical protein
MGSLENLTSTVTETELTVAPAPVEASFIVTAMQRLTDEYGKSLVNGTAAAYKPKSLADKSDEACMGWAARQETWHKSVELKGLHMSKLILRAALDTELTQPTNRYLPLVDYEYWHGVDTHVYRNIVQYVNENSKWGELLLRASYEEELPDGVFARINDNVVHRGVSLRPDGHENVVVYAVYPAEYPAQISGPVIL